MQIIEINELQDVRFLFLIIINFREIKIEYTKTENEIPFTLIAFSQVKLKFRKKLQFLTFFSQVFKRLWTCLKHLF